MKISKRATSIVEAMVVMVIIVTGLVGLYSIYDQSNKLVISVKNKIQAIQIAREGIEAFTNIRDTNWLIFPSDYENCWNTLNYDKLCVGNNSPQLITEGDRYKIYRDSLNRWKLDQEPILSGLSHTDSTFRDYYKVSLDSKGLYTQSGGTEELLPLFTREINIKYLDAAPHNALEVKSIVTWADASSGEIRNIELKTILKNWKK